MHSSLGVSLTFTWLCSPPFATLFLSSSSWWILLSRGCTDRSYSALVIPHVAELGGSGGHARFPPAYIGWSPAFVVDTRWSKNSQGNGGGLDEKCPTRAQVLVCLGRLFAGGSVSLDIQLWSPSPYMNRRFKLYLCENWRLIRKILFTEWLSHYFQGDMAPISSWFKISSCLIYCPLKHFFLLKKEMSRKSAFRCPHNYMERKWDSQKPLHFKKTPFPKRSIFKCLYWLTPQPVDQAGEAHRFFEETC